MKFISLINEDNSLVLFIFMFVLKNIMEIENIKTQYRRKLNHIQPIGAIFFVTFRLFDSIPKVHLKELKNKYKDKVQELEKIEDSKERNMKLFFLRMDYFKKYDRLLDDIENSPKYLVQDSISKIVTNQIHQFDKKYYDLIAYTIMSNHVHLLIDTSIQLPSEIERINLFNNYVALDQIMKRIKGPTAVYSNRILGRNGQFWERESFDVYIRNNKMLINIISYILENPVKAGIVNFWEDYKWNYLKDFNKSENEIFY